ncbi:MAG: FAD-binding oxidoreductase [Deltaproteobacteria bacterium]|nr:FAD-binding oxidoreductase [Deltaproteobacteria bacterium]MBT6433825.1 FAD-binding oxidoreductase [Deltaproteobacteria bacterium]
MTFFNTFTRERVLKILLRTVVVVALLPVGHIFLAFVNDNTHPRANPPPDALNDASHLNITVGVDIVHLSPDLEATQGLLRDAFEKSVATERPVSIGGARHSMGRQSLNRGGIYIDTTGFNRMKLDEESNILKVQAGAIWKDVIAYLHPLNRAVSVMQTNHDFSVGGTLSVNAHGWQHDKGPVGSTVVKFDLMLADGTIHRCSPSENSELFSLALGGYGLFGVILDVWLNVVPNAVYQSTHKTSQLDGFVEVWNGLAQKDNVQMLYGRLSIDPGDLFGEVLLTGYSPIPWSKPIPPLEPPKLGRLGRAVFRGSVESDFGKKIRWTLEKWAGGEASGTYPRSVLQNEPVELFANRDPERTDILHEYFIPPGQVVSFIKSAGAIVSSCETDLLNVTVRSVNEDTRSFLRYADQDMFALVMLFNYERTLVADKKMQACTVKLIDTALAHNGRYYLPYRLHATQEQFEKAYPQARSFFSAKMKWDENELFQNGLYHAYGKSLLSAK